MKEELKEIAKQLRIQNQLTWMAYKRDTAYHYGSKHYHWLKKIGKEITVVSPDEPKA